MEKKTLISVIIPCYCSGACLEDTVRGIQTAFAANPSFRLQLILVDDASPDDGQTAAAIHRLCRKSPDITGIFLKNNLGQARAKMAGLKAAAGRYAVFMDDDGQHDPACLFGLIEALQNSPACVHIAYAQFPVLRETLPRRLASHVHNLILTFTVHKPAGLTITSYFAVDARALQALREYQTRKPFIGGYLMCLFGPQTAAAVPVSHRTRQSGTSTYSLGKLFKAFFALHTSGKDAARCAARFRDKVRREKKFTAGSIREKDPAGS